MEVDCLTVKAKLDAGADMVLLDCREQDEHDHVRIDGCRLIPMSEIQDRIGELDDDRNREIIVYCHHGARSLQVARWMKHQGFEQVVSMAGGIDRWALQIDKTLLRY